jgi:signal peptidase II
VWLVALAVAGIDQATKAWAVHALGDGHSVPIIGSVLRLSLVYNEGAALSILGEHTIVVTGIMLAIMVFLVWFHGRARGILGIAVFGAAMGGAIGNLYDRFFVGAGMGKGPVIDMICYGDVFIGNVADIAIVLAAAAVIIASWVGRSVITPRSEPAGEASPQ